MKLFIHSLEKTLYEGDARVVTLPGESGEVSILDNHTPLVSALKKGTVRVRENENSTKEFPIFSGFAQVNKGHTVILVNL